MTNPIEYAIAHYSSNRSKKALDLLDRALVQNNLIVPVKYEVNQTDDKKSVIPVICLRTIEGKGAIPAFTTVDQLLNWKPEGCNYVDLHGKSLLEMALGMQEISEIVINVNGTPRGAIPRSEFDRLFRLG